MAEVKLEKTPCDRELIEKILAILEKHEKLLPQFLSDKHKLYDNKTLMAKLGVREKYLKKLRDNGYLGYSREGDKYWYTQEDVDCFLRRFHYSLRTKPPAPRRAVFVRLWPRCQDRS